MLQGLIRLGHPWLLKALCRHWSRGDPPDLVVSLVPNFNLALRESVAKVLPGVPFVTVMTDLADLPPRFWIEPSVDQHIVCGTERAAAQAREAGCRADRIHRTSGMPIRPEFYLPRRSERRAERLALGLDPDLPTGIVMFGGQGSTQMRRIARVLADRQLILLCGRDEALAANLRGLRREAPHAVLGFTGDVRRYMDIADFFIGKPGPGALSEALHCGLPVLTFRNAWTMPQERYNAQWVVEQGVGLAVDSTRRLGPAVRELLGDLDRYRAGARALRNRAVFEIPAILQRLLAAGPSPATERREPVEATP
jgi:1,2-diacylglycerol 3-beta-galactosyltransferase